MSAVFGDGLFDGAAFEAVVEGEGALVEEREGAEQDEGENPGHTGELFGRDVELFHGVELLLVEFHLLDDGGGEVRKLNGGDDEDGGEKQELAADEPAVAIDFAVAELGAAMDLKRARAREQTAEDGAADALVHRVEDRHACANDELKATMERGDGEDALECLKRCGRRNGGHVDVRTMRESGWIARVKTLWICRFARNDNLKSFSPRLHRCA